MLVLGSSHVQKVPRQPLNKGRPGSRVTFFPSRKLGHPITCGNLTQADLCVHLEYSSEVDSYECRPAILQFEGSHFKADFCITLSDGSSSYLKLLPYNVQYQEHDDECHKLKLRLRDEGITVAWLASDDLPSPLQTSNLRCLYYYSFGANQRLAQSLCKYVMGLKGQRATVEMLLAYGACTADIYLAIFLGGLHVHLDQKLSPQSMVYGRPV
ncbi:hypothetical protein [Pseudomonas pudica]|uniref:Anaphase-promoting complex subunit 1 n=1 Tax=Pseudomonas pudica TaxID=272772 RepID=A0ABS0FUL4_9PSED|nr:hypothetical protein [Pseudomonas pudica]MBF8644068.1 hypothetical protein [Pseudomonas pudica]MBF8758565.1 hypothetical protein [Pseudomonas pudica]